MNNHPHRPRDLVVPTLLAALAVVGMTGASQAQSPLTIADGAAPNADCAGRDVAVIANDATVTLLGGCRSLTVTGARTTVNAEMRPQARIAAPGQGDRVYWYLRGQGPDPEVGEVGPNSQVLRQQRLGSVIAPPSDVPADTGDQPALELTASADQRCGGRDAHVTADRARIVLRDRCRSLTVTGSGDTVDVELQSGSRVRIVGNDSVVQFVLVDVGPDPIVSVAGNGNTAYRIQRLGAADRADASRGVAPTGAGMEVQGGAGASVVEMPAVPQPTQPDLAVRP